MFVIHDDTKLKSRESLIQNITECRGRVLRAVVNNTSLSEALQEALECTKAVLSLPNAKALYAPLTAADGVSIDQARLKNPELDHVAAQCWTIVAAKISTLYKQEGWTFRTEEFFIIY